MQQGCRSGESARLPPMCPGFDSQTWCHIWVEFVVGSLLCSKRFFSGYSGFPLSSKTNISKFQFDLDVRHFRHEPLARVIAQALPVLDVKLTFTFFFTFLPVACFATILLLRLLLVYELLLTSPIKFNNISVKVT